MAYEVRVSEAADRDTDGILTYLVEELASPKSATDFVDALDKKYSLLEDHPYMFELSRNERLAQMGYRRFIVGNYVALYLVDDKNHVVNIARIFYGKRECEKYI